MPRGGLQDETDPTPAVPKRHRILLADDKESIRQLVGATLGGEQFDLLFAPDGEQALISAIEHKPDLVLLDVDMPYLSGFEVCRTLKRHSGISQTRVIMLTALASEDDLAVGREAGADDYIVKPFSPLQLLRKVHEILERPSVQSGVLNADCRPRSVRPTIEQITANLVMPEALAAAQPGYVALQDRVRELEAAQGQLLIYAEELNQTYREIQATYFSTLEALAAAIDARDPYTYGHSQRVAHYSVEIARLMGLDPSGIEVLRRAALLHDIGKIGISDATLLKPGPLDADEWAQMKRHPEIGEHMIAGLKFLADAAPCIRHHHERWDGQGYPDGLQADGIPLGARILTVADSFDAMTSTRPYRRALRIEEARAEAERGRNKQFDGQVVQAFQDGIDQIIAILVRENPR